MGPFRPKCHLLCTKGDDVHVAHIDSNMGEVSILVQPKSIVYQIITFGLNIKKIQENSN